MYQDTRNIYCEACGYELRDQRSGNCPECGQYYDRGEGSGYRDTPISAIERYARKSCGPLGGISYLVMSLVFFGLYMLPPRDRFQLLFAMLMCVMGFASLIRGIFWPTNTKG